MAARGMMSSGMRSQAEKETAYQKAMSNANADIQAPDQVAQMQSQWLNRGDQQKTQAANLMSVGGNMMNAGYTAEAQANQNVANTWLQGGSNAVGQSSINTQAAQYDQNTRSDALGSLTGSFSSLAGGGNVAGAIGKTATGTK